MEELKPPTVPDRYPLEPTHFLVTSVTAVIPLINAMLDAIRGTTVYNLPKFKWKGITRDKTFDYRIKLFQTDRKGVFIVELQRRSVTGYHLLQKMVVELHDKCVAEGILCDKDGTPVTTLRREPTSVCGNPRLGIYQGVPEFAPPALRRSTNARSVVRCPLIRVLFANSKHIYRATIASHVAYYTKTGKPIM